jgi:6-pyruvoyltetrahydropterin/6-carboxytetrahydropterin synthase
LEVKQRVDGSYKFPDSMKYIPVALTKEFDFEAAHHLAPYEGRCENTHGHSYHMEVSVLGIPDAVTGMVMDFRELKESVNCIIDSLDHNYLNGYFDFNTTCENMIRWIWYILDGKLPTGIQLNEIKLWETRTSFAVLNRSMIPGGVKK